MSDSTDGLNERRERIRIPAARFLPKFTFELGEEELTGQVRFADVHEGVGGVAHGGIIAALFDQFLGATASIAAIGRTVTLTVDFRSLTPIETDLDLYGKLEKVEGRKIWVSGSISHEGRVCAEASGLWIAVDIF